MTENNPLAEERPELEAKLSELDILKQSLDEAKLREKNIYDQLLRLGADFENYRKRADQRISDARNFGREDVIMDILTLGDALIQAEASSQTATDLESLKKGISLVLSQFEKFLKDQRIDRIIATGEKVDPHKHEVLAQVEKDDVEEGIIVDEIQRGYSRDGHVIRFSKVRVASKPTNKEDSFN